MALSLVCRIAVRPLLGRSEERTSRRGSARRQSRSHDRRNLCLRSSSLQSYQLRMVVARAPQRQDGHRALLRPVAASKPDRTSQLQQPGTSQLSDEVEEDDPTPFFEPLLRSFVLGLGVGVIFESGHVALRFLGLLWEMGYHQTVDILPRVQEQFAPLFISDHFAAAGAWVLFYTIEAAAIYSILRQHPNDKQAAATALRDMRPLPKRMLPSRLQLLKSVLRVFKPLGLQPALAGSSPSSSSSSGSDRTFQPQLPQQSLEPPQSTAFVDDSGTATSPAPGPTNGPDQGVQAANGLLVQPQGSLQDGIWAFVEEEEPEAVPQIQPDEQAPEVVQYPNEVVLPKPLAKARQEKGLKPGQWDPNSMGRKIAQREKELNGRRLYLKNFWYAAALSEKIKDKPVGVEVCGEKLVLWRGADGAVHCINDVCPHRGAPLSLGWLETHNEQQCVVCPYHGWAFDAAGVCQHVPAAENMADRPKQSITEAYSVQEKGGFVWLFYGSKQLPREERPDIPFTSQLEDPLWRPVYGEIEFDCPHWGVFENAIDMAHIHYLHGDSFGNKDQPQIRDMTCKRLAWGVQAAFRLHNKPVNALWNFSKVPDVKVTATALLPSTSIIGFTLGNGLSFITFVNTVPINAHKTVNRFCLIRSLAADQATIFAKLNPFFNWSGFDVFARKAMIKILSEDKAMVEQLRPQMVLHEAGVRADIPQQRFRALRQEYIDLGYGVDPQAPEDRIRVDF